MIASHDRLRSKMNRLLRGTAKAIERHAGHFNWEPGQERRAACDAHALLADLTNTTDDNVSDFGFVYPGAFDQAFQCVRQQLIGTCRAQCTFVAANWGAHSVYNDGFCHDAFSY
jgi:hypothetical protein